MDFLTHILLDYGYWGMFLSALLAGSVLPFSSEVVLVGLIASGLDPILLLIYGTTGNVLGGLINYGLGRMGKLEWLQRYFHVSQKSLDRAQWQGVVHGWDSLLFCPSSVVPSLSFWV